MRVEKSQRTARHDGLDPKCDLGKFQRHWVEIHAIDAIRDDVPQGLTIEFARHGLGLARTNLRQRLGHPTSSSKQKVRRAAGRIQNRQRQNRRFAFRIARLAGKAFLDERINRRLHQLLDKTGRRIIASARLAGIAGRQALLGDADKTKSVRHARNGRYEFQQRLINRTELLGVEVAVVDQLIGPVDLRPTQGRRRLQKRLVIENGFIKVRRKPGSKQSAQRGKRKFLLAVRERTEDDLDRRPKIGMPVVSRGTQSTADQAMQRVALPVDVSRIGRRIRRRREKRLAFLGRIQKEKPIGDAEQFLKVGRIRERTVVHRRAQGRVARVVKEAVTENLQGTDDAIAQVVEDAYALLLAQRMKLLPNGIVARTVRSCAVVVAEPPEKGEVGITLFGEDALKVELDPAGPCERVVIPNKAQEASVGDDGPEVVIALVEPFLRILGHRTLAPRKAVTRETRGCFVKLVIEPGEENRECAGSGQTKRHGIIHRRSKRKAKRITEKRFKELPLRLLRLLLPTGQELLPRGDGDAKSASVFVGERHPRRNGIGIVAIKRTLEKPLQHIGRKERPLKLEGFDRKD